MSQENNWEEEVGRLRSILLKTGMETAIKWGGEVFTHQGKNVVSIGAFKNHFTLWFYDGVFLNDPLKVLVSAKDGNTKALRQWRFTSYLEIDDPSILAYAMEAMRNAENGMVWKPVKSRVPDVPDILSQAFARDSTLKTAFHALSAYKQKEYIEHITAATREATRLSRLEKAISQILRGEGLHDKYMKS